jgi:AraC family transcriptional regulator of adaptative response/methylated-DNA-[protein]-cysteine methyltransferase
MNSQEATNYKRIAVAIDHIKLNFKEYPDLDEVASEVNLSACHFQVLFTEWATTRILHDLFASTKSMRPYKY